MAGADRYLNGLNKIRKKRAENPDIDIQTELRRAFFASIAELPDSLVHDLFDYFYEKSMKRAEDILDVSKEIADVIDLFDFAYDEGVETLTMEDWEYIKEAVSDAALDMPEDLLTYVMALVVDQGLFDSN